MKSLGMTPTKPVFFLVLILNLLFASNAYANENIFELIAPSSYKPANLLREFEVIDDGSYRLNINQNINALFPQHEISHAVLYLVLPNTCTINKSSAEYETQHRTDYSYYVFKPESVEANRTFDVSMELKTVTVSSKDFGFIVIARDSTGETLVHNKHDNSIHKEIIIQEYLSVFPKDPAQ